MRWFTTCAATLFAAAALTACGSASNSSSSSGGAASTSSAAAGAGATSSTASGSGSASGSPIQILDVTATSGATAIFGQQETYGLQAAAAYYNAHGGILGHKIEIKVVNDNSDPATATSIATRELASNPHKYTMVWAGEEGTATASLIPVMKRFSVFATAVDDGNNACAHASACPNLFTQVGPISLAEVSDAAAFKKAGITKVGIIADQATYDQSELAFMQPDLTRDGVKFVTVTFPPSAVSLTPEMSQLKSDGVQAVFAEALGPSAGYVLSARASLGWSVPVEFDITGSSTDITTLVPKSDYKDVTETIHYCMDTKHNIPSFDQMVKYTPHPLAGNITCPIAGDGWGGMALLAAAAEKAKSLDTSALTKAAESLKISNTQPDFPFVAYQQYCWTAADHENVCNQPSDFEVVPLGRLKNTRLAPLS